MNNSYKYPDDDSYDDDSHGQPEESFTDTEAVAWAYKKLLDYRVESASMDNAMMMDRLKNLLMGY